MGFTDKFLSKMGFHPRNGAADGYPFDFDGSLRHVRPRTGIDYYPSHSNRDNFAKLGLVSGFMPLMDAFKYSTMVAPIGYGPSLNPAPANLQWQIIVPGLDKQMPSQ